MNIEASNEITGLYRIGGVAAALQLVVILGYAVVARPRWRGRWVW